MRLVLVKDPSVIKLLLSEGLGLKQRRWIQMGSTKQVMIPTPVPAMEITNPGDTLTV